MASNFLPFQILFALIPIIMMELIKTDDINCNQTDKCLCFAGYNDYEYQCPPGYETNRIVMHVENDNSILIDCYDLETFDLNILPNITVTNTGRLTIRTCPLPPDGFSKILNKFQININELLLKFELTNLSNIVLGKQFFEGLNNLKYLALDSNDLIDVDEDIFANTPNLLLIDLKDNNIHLKPNMFQYTPFLRSLDIVGNNLNELPNGLFDNLYDMRILHLWKNNLKTIDKYIFKHLISMTSLELSYNKIEFIDEEALANCTELINISLLSNNLKFLPRKLFQKNSLLELVRLGNNPFSELPDYLFSNFPNLKTVHLINSNLRTIPAHIFENSTNLETVLLGTNYLTELSPNLFKGLEKLKKLSLENNQLKNLNNFVLKSLKGLEILNVENNLLTEIGDDLLLNLNNLKEINFNRNQIKIIDGIAFRDKGKLTKISLAYNQIVRTEFNGVSIFNPCTNLEILDLQSNLITEFDSDLSMGKVHLRSLDMSNNRINAISINQLMKVSNHEVTINLSNNNITQVDFSIAVILARENVKSLDAYSNTESSTLILLSNNPIECDCHALDLVKYFRDELDASVRTLFDIKSNNLTCARPSILKDYLVSDLLPVQMICHLGKLGNDSSVCSNKCDCMWKPHEKAIVVDCSHKNLTQIPEIKLPELPKSLKYKQIEVHLESNNITKGPNEAMKSYENVTKLYLSNNYIDTIQWLPSKLEILKLDNNKIGHIDYKVLEILNTTRLSNMTVHDNPWSCDCEAENLTNFLKHNLSRVDYTNIRCGNSKLLINMNHNDLCQPRTKLYLVIGIVVTLSLCIFAILYALYWRFNQEIKVWCYAHSIFLNWVTEEELDKDKIYDAFLSYSHKDEDFVIENLLPVLEGGTQPYKLCIHVRNWIAGEFITNQIINSVRDSRRTLVVLSTNFLDSVWGKMEFRTAHTQAMSEGRARVIIILLGDIDMESLDDELKTYMKTNTYVKWGDPWFWDKVRYALPHANKRLQTNKQKHANIMSTIDDKFSLVVKNMSTTNPGSTPPVLTLDNNLLKKDPLQFTIRNQNTPPAESGNDPIFVNNS